MLQKVDFLRESEAVDKLFLAISYPGVKGKSSGCLNLPNYNGTVGSHGVGALCSATETSEIRVPADDWSHFESSSIRFPEVSG